MTAETGSGDLERLRQLLLDDERQRLSASLARVEALEQRQRELPQRLPGLLRRAAQGEGADRLGEALAAPVAGALSVAIRGNRRALIDTLFPLIGPTIRKAIAEAMRNLAGEINAALVSSLSLRGLRWRLESWRSGVPYSQVVLRHTLSYRIDHVFLIERGSGLLLHHGHQPELFGLDGDAIAGMLTAIGEFVRDSVDRDGEGTLNSARVGEYLLELESGPRATVACFVRGVPPARFHDVLAEIVEELHDGEQADDSGLALSDEQRLALQPAAIEQRIGQPAVVPQAGSLMPLLLVVLILLGGLFWHILRVERWQDRVAQLRTALEAHPGFVLVGSESKPWSSLTVHGLLDPDAAPLQPVLDGVDLGGVKPRMDLQGYLSSDDAVIRQRALRLLEPPAGVTLSVDRRVLRLQGRADAAWIERARAGAPLIAGVAGTELALGRSPEELQRLLDALGRRRLLFDADAKPRYDPEVPLDAMARDLLDAVALARELGVSLRVRVLGDNDRPGSDAINVRVREQRRDWLAAALVERGVPAQLLDCSGLGVTNQRAARLQLEIGK